MEHVVYNGINLSGVQMGQTRCQSSRSILELYLRSQRGHLCEHPLYVRLKEEGKDEFLGDNKISVPSCLLGG